MNLKIIDHKQKEQFYFYLLLASNGKWNIEKVTIAIKPQNA